MNHHEQFSQTPTTDTEQGVLGVALNKFGNYLKPVGRRVTAGAAAVTLAIVLAGCGVSAQGEGPEKDDKGTSASPTPDATGEATPDVKEVKEYTDEDLLELMNEPLPEALAPYEAMSVVDFEKAPIEERLAYCSYLNRDADYIQTEFYKGYGEDPRYLLPETFDESSSAQDIVGGAGIFPRAAFVTHFGGKVYDRDTSQKLLACSWLTPSSEAPSATYKFWTDARNEATVIGTPAISAQNGNLQVGTATGEEPSTTITTPDGKERVARTVSFNDTEGNSFESTYVLVNYTDYKGEPKGKYVAYDEVIS